jgi:hypothetical protein
MIQKTTGITKRGKTISFFYSHEKPEIHEKIIINSLNYIIQLFKGK